MLWSDVEISWLEGDGGKPVVLPFDPPFGLSGNAFVLGQVAVIVVTFLLWFLLFGLTLRWTRPTPIAPAPPTQDFPGEEPPAVVSLLANRWRVTEDAVESTLLDLAARHWLELRQPAADPLQTTVHVLTQPAKATPLNRYEQQVLDRVNSESRGGVVPITALTFRDAAEANRWRHKFESAVIADARERGLSRRRFSQPLLGLLNSAALIPSAAVALFAAELAWNLTHLFWGLFAFAALSTIASRPLGERDTPEGREVARGWLGLREFLRRDEVFAELPPSAVAVWDRYLSYGDALGTTRVCAMLLDLGLGDRKRLWSSYTGQWRQVRVKYPRFWGRYGKSAPRLLLAAVAQLAAGVWAVRAFGVTLRIDSPGHIADLVLGLIALYLVARGIYRLARTLADLAAPRTIDGEVLWVQEWQSKQQGENSTVVVNHHLALDDGTADRVMAWVAPTALAGGVRDGDEARIVVRPWSRRITSVTRTRQRHERLGDQPKPQAATEFRPRSAPQ